MSTDAERPKSAGDTGAEFSADADTASMDAIPEFADGIRAVVDAALFASTETLTVRQLSELFDPGQAVTEAQVRAALDSLEAANADRGIELVQSARGFRYRTRPGLSPWLNRLWEERPRKLSRAMMETLALIAYRQPITRGEIEEVRGVSVASTIIRNLMDFDWIRVAGYRDVPGRPALFATTDGFLESFGVQSLDELPPLSEIKSLAELEPEFDFGGESHSELSESDAAEGGADLSDADQNWSMDPAFTGTDLSEIDRINASIESGWNTVPDGEDGNPDQGEETTPDADSAPDDTQHDGSNLTEAEQLAIIEQKLKQQQARMSDHEDDATDASDDPGNDENDDGNEQRD